VLIAGPIGLSKRSATAVAEHPDAAVFAPLEDLVAGLPRNAELGAPQRHLLALQQAGDKPESLVHDVTREQSVIYPLGICCYLTLRKDIQ